MESRMKEKEDERNERIVRGLAKLPANRRCINCNSQVTQYVCTNFATFICIHCSGIHREFTHRVKSISMAKFTSQEISALQQGGNENAKNIYFKEWDFQRYTLPDNSDVDKLRDFIKFVYVDRRFTSDRNADKPRVLKNEKEESRSNRPSNSQTNTEPSPAKNTETNSDDRQKEIAPAVKEPVVPPVRLLEPPKMNKPATQNTQPVQIQSTIATSNNNPQITQNAPEAKKPIESISLIDFDYDFDSVPKQQTSSPANQNEDVGWASFDTQKNTPSSLHSYVVHRPAPGLSPVTNYSQLHRPAVAGLTNQNWGQVTQPVGPNMGTTSAVPNQFQSQTNQVTQHLMHGPRAPPHLNPASNTRNTHPEDLFGMVHGGPVPGWQGAPRVMMGYAIQYPMLPPNDAYYHPVRSSNPFDFNTEPKLAHANTFPSMTSLQGALPHLSFSHPNHSPNPNPNPNPNLLSRASSTVSFGSQWDPQHMQQNPYQHQMQTVNMPQQIPTNMIYHNGNQVMGGYGTIRNPNSYSQVGDNPFS